MKSLEVTEHFLVMLVNHGEFGFLQDKCSKTREKDWDSKDSLSMETGSRVTTVSTSYSSMEYCTKSPIVCRELVENRGEVSSRRAQ